MTYGPTVRSFEWQPPLRPIRIMHPVCSDTRRAIDAHLERRRVGLLLAAERARPALLPVPAVKACPGR